MNEIIRFKNIKFYNYSFKYIYNKLISGGYLVAPAASSLSTIENKKNYYLSLRYSDIAILDSGFFCILLKYLKSVNVKKFSGYLFLKLFFNHIPNKKKKIFLIDPSLAEQSINKDYLRKKGFFNSFSYIAPLYNNANYKDEILIKKILKLKPNIIIINIGGGVQEPLAFFLKQKLRYRVGIICTGAAIGFFTKQQAPISDFFDKYYLGWMIRAFHRPRLYFPRIISSLRLIRFFF